MALYEVPVRQRERTLVTRIVSHCQSLARMLAIVAAMVLALGIHSPHAVSERAGSHQAVGQYNAAHHVTADHNLFGFACVKAKFDRSAPGTSHDSSLGHADCTQGFDPLQRSPAADAPDFTISVVTAPRELSFRQVANSFEPPPPRLG